MFSLRKRFQKKKKVLAIVPIQGEIYATPSGSYNKKGGTQDILDFLYDYLDPDTPIDGLLLRMDTPGGTAGASEELAELVARIKRERHIPVVVTIADICCSGGYMIACVADKIFANKGSMTGSIGCIMQIPNFEGLSKKLGVTYVTIKSGRMKDIGNPMREMTDEERAYLDTFARETHEAFVAHVEKYRPQIKDQEHMFDGRPVGAVLARENGLIDEFGGYYDAYDELLQLMGEKNDHKVDVEAFERKKSLLHRLLGNTQAFSVTDIMRQFFTKGNYTIH